MTLGLIGLFALTFSVFAQNESDEDIVAIIDDLRYKWDDEATKLESFEGMEKYCHERHYKKEVTDLLNKIHHYDTSLYFIVTEKYSESNDPIVKETLEDIVVVEEKYTTPNFIAFLEDECEKVKTIEKHERRFVNEADEEKIALEQELLLYIESVTSRIDIIDENIHHLDDL